MSISFDDALRRQRRLVVVLAVIAGLVAALWCALGVCEISSDLIAPRSLPVPALGIIAGIGLLLAVVFCAVLIAAARTAGAREQQRVSAAIRAQHLPSEVDPARWLPILRARADSRRLALQVLPTAVLAVVGVTQLARHDDLYATLLWSTYFLAALGTFATATLTSVRGRPAARRLLADLEARATPAAPCSGTSTGLDLPMS
jgi:hypothetical protein